jgi:hypothetical protein
VFSHVNSVDEVLAKVALISNLISAAKHGQNPGFAEPEHKELVLLPGFQNSRDIKAS